MQWNKNISVRTHKIFSLLCAENDGHLLDPPVILDTEKTGKNRLFPIPSNANPMGANTSFRKMCLCRE